MCYLNRIRKRLVLSLELLRLITQLTKLIVSRDKTAARALGTSPLLLPPLSCITCFCILRCWCRRRYYRPNRTMLITHIPPLTRLLNHRPLGHRTLRCPLRDRLSPSLDHSRLHPSGAPSPPPLPPPPPPNLRPRYSPLPESCLSPLIRH